MAKAALLLLATARLAVGALGSDGCQAHTLDFILLGTSALSQRIEDDIRRDLARININVNTRLLAKPDFNAAMQRGDFDLCFTQSWGPPYDPHSFATGWFMQGNEAHYAALDGLEAPMTKARLQQMVTDVLKTTTISARQTQWTAILREMHSQAISNPLWSSRMPAVVNRRLQGYRHGQQQFDYPMHEVQVASGSTTVRVSPGAQTGLFATTGPMDPHSYRPNEFFISNWIYERLVSYGENGVPKPQLATAWTVTATSGGGQEYRFTLRSNVSFHDGTPFNCAAVKMTFDHVASPLLAAKHSWCHLFNHLSSWSCDGEVFVARLSDTYYPFLQELSFIRPLAILSPACYADGPASDPALNNSCPAAWDRFEMSDGSRSQVRCGGIRCSAGTGPWKFKDKTMASDGATVQRLRFDRNADWWGVHGNVQELVVEHYATSDAVKAALLGGSLDMVVGAEVLAPAQVQEIDRQHSDRFEVSHGPPLLNHILVMNAARAPLSDLSLRKTVMHAVDKAAIVDAELAGSARVATSVFPRDAPYCDVDLTPRWDYDLEKARLINCPQAAAPAAQEDGPSLGLILGLTFGLGIPCLIAVGAAAFCFGKRSGYSEFKEKQVREGQTGAPPESVGGGAGSQC